MTAHRALTVSEDGPDRLHPDALAGKVVLVAGGAGAVGHSAIQLARWAGATVISTISGPAKAALATAAGAHHVVNYREEDAASAIANLAPDGVDLVVEVAISTNAELNVAVVKPRASVAIYADDGGGEFKLAVRDNMIKNVRYQFVLLYTVGTRLWPRPWTTSRSRYATGPCPLAKPPACRCTGLRWPTPRTRTRPSRTARSARC